MYSYYVYTNLLTAANNINQNTEVNAGRPSPGSCKFFELKL